MSLQVLAIKFLPSGKIHVEVGNTASSKPPMPPVVDTVRLTLYMEFAPTDTIQQIKDKAIQIARGTIKD